MAYKRHPVYLRARAAGVPEERIYPVSIYWDGVQYTKHDGLWAFYVRDLFYNTQYLQFLLRAAPSGCDLAF